MRSTPRIIAFSGTHGTGKTTAAYAMAKKLQVQGHTVGLVQEQARYCPYPVNREMTEKSQMWIFTAHLQAELNALKRYPVVVCDRTIIDPIAYCDVAGFHALAGAMFNLALHHYKNYHTIVLKSAANNDHWYPDGFREAKDSAFRRDVDAALLARYEVLENYRCSESTRFLRR